MQPPAMIHTAHSAARTARDLSRPRRDRIRGLAPGRALGFDRRDTLALLEGHRRLLHDRLVALQSSLDVDRGPEVATEHHLLKTQRVLWPHDRDPGALRVEDDRGGWYPPVRARRRDLERDVDEHSREQPVRRVGDVDLRQQCPRAWIDRA